MAKPFNALKDGLGMQDRFTFGKYCDAYVSDVIDTEPTYIFWLVANTDILFTKEVLTESIKEFQAKKVDAGAKARKIYGKEMSDYARGSPDGYGTGSDPFDVFDDIPF